MKNNQSKSMILKWLIDVTKFLSNTQSVIFTFSLKDRYLTQRGYDVEFVSSYHEDMSITASIRVHYKLYFVGYNLFKWVWIDLLF